MRKILLCHSLFPTDQQPQITGGAEVCARDLAQGLAQRFGHQVTVLRGLPPQASPRVESFGDIKVHALPLRRPYWLYDGNPRRPWEKLNWHGQDDWGRAPKAAAELIAELRPDTVIFGNIVGLGWRLGEIARAQGAKVVQVLHDYYHLCPAMTLYHDGRGCGPLCRGLTHHRRRGFSRLDGVIGVSRAVLDHHRPALGPETKTTVIPNTPRPYNGPMPTANRRATPVFGFLGRLSPEKGLEALIDALPPNSVLKIGGRVTPAQEAHLRRRCAQGRHLDFLGFVTPEMFFPQIDVLVVPSLWDEPFGLVSIEAQTAGVPVIVSGRGGLPEGVIHGITGWVLPRDDPPALRRQLAQIMAAPSLLPNMSKAAIAQTRHTCKDQALDTYNAFLNTVHAPHPLGLKTAQPLFP